MTPEVRSTGPNYVVIPPEGKSFLEEQKKRWLAELEEVVSLLPSDDLRDQARKLPEVCQKDVVLAVKMCRKLASGFPFSPVTPHDEEEVSYHLEQKTLDLAGNLINFGDRPFENLWNDFYRKLMVKIGGLRRRELIDAWSESISQDAKKIFDSMNKSSPLANHFLEAVRSFAGPSVAWAAVSDQSRINKNFFILSLPIYGLGASVIGIGNDGEGEVLTARFLYKDNGGKIGQKTLIAPLVVPAPSIYR